MKKIDHCKSCEFWVFTNTLGNPEGCWHCDSGFTYSSNCKEFAARNRKVRLDRLFALGRLFY